MTEKEKAIAHLENMKWLKGYDNTTVGGKPIAEIIDGIIALLKPQEPCEDTVSRADLIKTFQAAIDTTPILNTRPIMDVDDVIQVVRDCPSVTPKAQEPCEDAVSREDVLKEQYEVETQEFGTIYAVPADYIKSLLSVTPKAQAARLLTSEEVKESRPFVLWVEDLDAGARFFRVALIDGWYRDASYDWAVNVADKWGDYGIRWRCWTTCPDDKTRAETPWEQEV